MIVDFTTVGGPVYIGREKGKQLRRDLSLDDHDASGNVVDVLIPENTYTISSSFFLGLFEDSIVKAGSKQQFYDRYRFKLPDFLVAIVDMYADRALYHISTPSN